jgi:hypothetical protein
MGEEKMIITKCVHNKGFIILNLDNHISVMSEEEQKYFINWMKKEKPELMK